MQTFGQAVVSEMDITIREALIRISNGAVGAIVLVEPDGRLLGLVTDGDIRRALLQGIYIEEPLHRIVNPKPMTMRNTASLDERRKALALRRVRHLLIVDDDNRFIELVLSDQIALQTAGLSPVVIMAGGEGKRLRPLTENCPKPLLQLGGMPILERILRRFIELGFREFYISVNYLRQQIIDYFGDGHRFNVSISYLIEDRPLGTAGSLTLLPQRPEVENWLVTNGDLITDLDYALFHRYHDDQQATATMAVRKIRHSLGFGMVKVDGTELIAVEEKPTLSFFVNAGIYLLSRRAVEAIPKDEFFDMPDLFSKLRSEGRSCSIYEVHGSWIDVGTPEKLREADDMLRAPLDSPT